jgi:hypothetical protein
MVARVFLVVRLHRPCAASEKKASITCKQLRHIQQGMMPPTKKLPFIANIGIDLQPQADGQKEWILNLKKCLEIVLRFVPFLDTFEVIATC